MTYREAIKRLKECGIDSAEYDAAELFCRFGGASRMALPAERDREYDSRELEEAIEKRCGRMPLQYILGEWDFFGLTLEVCPDCLCPRGDTELTVETVLAELPPNARILELCTGSGCIPVALCSRREDVTAICTDVFENTLRVARRNAIRHRVDGRITFILSDIFARDLSIEDKSLDAIISNPPYIPTGDIEGLSPEVHCEPLAALDGGADGLDFYREILGYYRRYLKDDGFVALEIGYDQGEAIVKLAEENGFSCRVIKDLGGNDRCALCRTKNIVGE